MCVTLAICRSGVLNDHCSTNDHELSLDKCQHCDPVCPPITFTPPPNLGTSSQVQGVTPATQNVDHNRTRPEAKGLTAAALLRDSGLENARLSPTQLSGEGSPHSLSTTKAPKIMLSGASPGADRPANIFHESRETPGGCHEHSCNLLMLPGLLGPQSAPATLASALSRGAQPSSLKPAVFPQDFRSPA